jgi:hypothetical protein
MTKMLDETDLKEMNELDLMPRYSVLNIDDDVFYTPGDESSYKIAKPSEIVIEPKTILLLTE